MNTSLASRTFAFCSVIVVTACAPAGAPRNKPIPAVALPDCQPNLDGRITASELPFIVGAVARVRVGQNIDVNTRGDEGPGDTRVWDLTRPDPQDEPQGTLVAEAKGEQWFAEYFPTADLIGPLAPNNTTMGALITSDDGIDIIGAASSDENPPEGKTLLVYASPMRLYPLPLELGASATSQSRSTQAVLLGIPFGVDDTYSINVTARGEVILPDLVAEDVLRVTIRLEREFVVGAPQQQVTHVFVTECLGEVARLVSPFVPLSDDLPDEFATAAEVWRLGF